MVQVVSYGSLPAPRRLDTQSTRLAAARFAVVACAALATAAVVTYLSTSAPSVLYDGSPEPNNLEDNQVEGVWHNTDTAWEGINDVLPTEAGPWDDQNDPAVGYAFKNPGSVTSDAGWTGYYDTQLRDGQDVLPGPDVNDVMGRDPTLNGANALWGHRGGKNVIDPSQWYHTQPLTVNQMSNGDWAPFSYTYGGPSHSSVGTDYDGPELAKGMSLEDTLESQQINYLQGFQGSGSGSGR